MGFWCGNVEGLKDPIFFLYFYCFNPSDGWDAGPPPGRGSRQVAGDRRVKAESRARRHPDVQGHLPTVAQIRHRGVEAVRPEERGLRVQTNDLWYVSIYFVQHFWLLFHRCYVKMWSPILHFRCCDCSGWTMMEYSVQTDSLGSKSDNSGKSKMDHFLCRSWSTKHWQQRFLMFSILYFIAKIAKNNNKCTFY